MVATTMLHVRVDEETRDQAAAALDAMGLSMSEAVRMFLRHVAVERAIPFQARVPNAVSRAAMEEARAMRHARFQAAEALYGCSSPSASANEDHADEAEAQGTR